LLQSEYDRILETKIDPIDFDKWVPSKELANGNFDDLIDALVDFTQCLIGTDGIIEAREIFFTAMGKTFHNDPFYEARIQYFLDYLVFNHLIKCSNTSAPIVSIDQFVEHDLVAHKAPNLDSLKSRIHSLFHIDKVKKDKMWISDLLSGHSYELNARGDELFTGYQKKMILQSYLFSSDANHWLSRGVIIHPMEATKVIKKYIKTSKKAHDFDPNIIRSRLARQQIRHLRLKHVCPKNIYESDPR
jgi:hypothetical protein